MNPIELSVTEAMQIKNIHTETPTDHGKHVPVLRCRSYNCITCTVTSFVVDYFSFLPARHHAGLPSQLRHVSKNLTVAYTAITSMDKQH